MADRHLIDVHVLLVRDGDIMLTQRRDPNPTFDGLWHLPSGKLDAGESVLQAAAREAEEEVGVLIDPAHFRHVHTLHVSGSGPEPRLGLFFEARRWIGRPTNREPHKCSAVSWFPLTALPENSSTTRPSASPPTSVSSLQHPRLGSAAHRRRRMLLIRRRMSRSHCVSVSWEVFAEQSMVARPPGRRGRRRSRFRPRPALPVGGTVT